MVIVFIGSTMFAYRYPDSAVIKVVCYYKQKAWESYLLLVPLKEALAWALVVETSNAEAHACM